MRVSVLLMVLVIICYHVQAQSYVGIERECDKLATENLLSGEKSICMAASNPDFRLDSVISYRVVTENDSVLDQKTLYEYDLEKNISTEISYSYSEDQHVWFPFYKRNSIPRETMFSGLIIPLKMNHKLGYFKRNTKAGITQWGNRFICTIIS